MVDMTDQNPTVARAPPNLILIIASGFRLDVRILYIQTPSDLLTWTGEGPQGSAARAQAAGGVRAAGTLGRSSGCS